MGLEIVTITGADDGVNPKDLLKLTEEFPFAEWGILLSPRHQAVPRFPSSSWINWLCSEAEYLPDEVNLSIHLCGGYVRDILSIGVSSSIDDHPSLWSLNQRVQLNFHRESPEVIPSPFQDCLLRYLDIQFIFQFDGTGYDQPFNLALQAGVNAAPLFDTSGGEGLLPDSWPEGNLDVPYVGYAGGLGPDTLEEQLPLIQKAAGNKHFWIDMEGRVRDSLNRLDLGKVREVLSYCAPIVSS